MNSIKTVLYIAMSLDGYIAKPDGNLDWLTTVPNPSEGDYGYEDLISKVGTIVMGRRTYKEVIGFGVEWPYPEQETYVVTFNHQLKIESPNTYVLTGDIANFIDRKKQSADKDIWLVGGGQLVTHFINADLIDNMIITIIPKTIGEGIPLFTDLVKETSWQLLETKSYDTGVVNLTYKRGQ